MELGIQGLGFHQLSSEVCGGSVCMVCPTSNIGALILKIGFGVGSDKKSGFNIIPHFSIRHPQNSIVNYL